MASPESLITVEVSRDTVYFNGLLNDTTVSGKSLQGFPLPPGKLECETVLQGESWAALVRLDGQPAGFALFIRRSVGWDVHVTFEPTCRGRNALQAGKALKALFREVTGACRCSAWIPHWLPESLVLARHAGFKTIAADSENTYLELET